MGEECSLSAGSSFCAFGVNKDADKGNLKRGTVSTTAWQFRSLPPAATQVEGSCAAHLPTSFCVFYSLFQVLFLGYKILSGPCLSVHFNDALLLFSISNFVLKTATADSADQLISASSTAHLSFRYLFSTLGLFSYACICGYLFLWPKMSSLGWIIV